MSENGPPLAPYARALEAEITQDGAPVRIAATAQAIYGTLCVGLAIALLTGASGLLYARLGGLAFLFMAALCLLALPLCAGLLAPSEES